MLVMHSTVLIPSYSLFLSLKRIHRGQFSNADSYIISFVKERSGVLVLSASRSSPASIMNEDKISVVKRDVVDEDGDKPYAELEEVELAACKTYISNPQNNATEDSSASPAIDEKRLLRRLDFTLIPWMGVLYLMSFLDRAGIGNARVSCFSRKIRLRELMW